MRKIQLTYTVLGTGLSTLHQIFSLYDKTYEEVTFILAFTDGGTIHTKIKLLKVTKLVKSITRI